MIVGETSRTWGLHGKEGVVGELYIGCNIQTNTCAVPRPCSGNDPSAIRCARNDIVFLKHPPQAATGKMDTHERQVPTNLNCCLAVLSAITVWTTYYEIIRLFLLVEHHEEVRHRS